MFSMSKQVKVVMISLDAINMQITEQFGLKKSLDYLFQLIYISNKLFSGFDFQQDLGFLQIDNLKIEQFSETDIKRLLSYYLDLIEFFSHEKLLLIQDPVDKSRYSLTGGFSHVL
jgi:hypothetical protein